MDEYLERRKGGEEEFFRRHIGGGVYVTVRKEYGGVDVRRFFVPGDRPGLQATKKGIFIPLSRWSDLKNAMEKLLKEKPYLASDRPCYRRPDHENLMAAYECEECNPYGPEFDSKPFSFYEKKDY